MAQAILKSGGAGGVTSSDVTASKQQVLKGYKTVTRDSDDEIVEGTFPVTSDTDARLELWYYNDHGADCYVTRIPEGAYVKYYNEDGTQSWDPWIRIKRALIKSGINYHPELTIDTVTTCGERGQIPDRGDGAVVSYHQGREDWAGRIWVLFKNGWYHRNPYDDGQGHIHEAFVYVTYEQLKNLFGIDANKMLQGYSIAGVQGNIVPRPNENMTTEIVDIGWTNPKKVGFRFPPGYYPQVGQYQPIVEVNYGELASRIGVRADKMLNDTNILGVQGQIKIINTQNGNYRINKSAAFGIDGWSDVHNPVFWIDFPHGNGFYCRNDNHPHVCIDAVNLGTAGADSVLSGQTATSVQGVKFAGAIPRWICTTGDVISAVNGEGFAWDDVYAGRGRGIVMKILNGSFIQDANYVFLPSPNLQPWNIRQNVNINGVTGTMVDYGAGGVPFNGATFDGRLVSGVANKGFILEHIPRFLNFKNTGYGYAGIQDGGMKLLNGYGGNTHIKSAPDVGCVLSKSINLTPFRYIKIGFRFLTFRGDGTASQPARISLEAGVAPIGNAGGESYSNESHTVLKDIGQRSKSISHVMTSTRTNAGDVSDKSQQFMTLDVTDCTGHHFMYFMLGNVIHEYSQGSVYAAVVINYIEFMN
jgi:hypothetical protein